MTLRSASFSLLALMVLSIAPSSAFADVATSTPDTTPPIITAPADQSFAETSFPASPTLVQATATDDTDPSPVITYDPHSFPLGTTTVTWTATDSSGNSVSTTSLVIITDATPPAPTASVATITIRDGVHSFTGATTVADSTDPPVPVLPTGSTTTVDVAANSVLATLLSLDASTPDFEVTGLSYYPSYHSFIIDCIALSGDTSHCYNWTYAVNGAYPWSGVDSTALHDGDIVHFFFGSPRKTEISTSSVAAGQSFTATALRYDLDSGTYVPATGVTLGVGTPNPDFTFTELATSSVDSNGQALFTLSATGTYAVGIKEDFYFPNTNITVTDVTGASTTTSTPTDPTPPSGGGGGGGGTTHASLNIPQALSFLSSKQSADGSFGSPILSDWTAIAFAASDPGSTGSPQAGAAKSKLKTYLSSATPDMGSVTDYERHAMALEALGIDPYKGTPKDYITPIVDAFDGTQVGDAALVNDDIFAVFALLHAGYSPNDPMLLKIAQKILASQQSDGSWDHTADMTAAAVQALGNFFGPTAVDQPTLGMKLGKAMGYLASTQQSDGGWWNPDSTSWVQTMINSMLALDPAHTSPFYSSAGQLPNDSIAHAQYSDGGIWPTNSDVNKRTWSTGYAVVAASGKYWMGLLQSFPKPTITTSGGGGGGGGGGGIVLGASTSTLATSTIDALVSSSTPDTSDASSTPDTFTLHPQILATSTVAHADIGMGKKVTVKPKQKVVPAPAPVQKEPETTSQAAAASAPPAPGIMSRVWHAVVSFFSRFF